MIILDTNLWISFELNRSSQLGQHVTEAIASSAYAFSDQTFGELTEVLLRQKFDRFLPYEQRIVTIQRYASERFL